ncbi:MAG: hypothetical protein HKO53_07755 [Gemmatimonadetes bacterium]|nr:hypothetical protein [Gemmatimonadota bacterium]
MDFVLIGAQKAGSTFLHHAILHHPGLRMPVGEVPVFEYPTYSPGALEWLDGLLSQTPGGAVRGIKRPDYLGRPEAPRLIHRHAPDCRLLVVLREPVSRTVSAYYHYMRRGHLPALPPDEGIPLLIEGAFDEAWPRAWEVLAFSRYGECLDRYLDLFRPEQLCLLVQDDVIRDPSGALRRIYEHLGVDADYVPPGLDQRALPTVYSLPRVRFLAWAQCFRPDEHGFAPPALSSLPGQLLYLAAMGLDRAVLGPLLGNPRPVLRPSTLEALRQALADDRPRVLGHLGRVPSSWSP